MPRAKHRTLVYKKTFFKNYRSVYIHLREKKSAMLFVLGGIIPRNIYEMISMILREKKKSIPKLSHEKKVN